MAGSGGGEARARAAHRTAGTGSLPDLPAPGIAFEGTFLQRLERFVLRVAAARERREGAGRSSLAGGGEEFVGYRPYRPGEDLRHVDWNLFARLDRPFVRVSRREAREDWAVLLDTSASMGVGRPGKLQAAAEIAVAVAAVGLHEGARVTCRAGADGPVVALRRRAQLGAWLGRLERTRAEGERGLGVLLDPERVRGAARVFAVGDLLDTRPDELLRLARRGRELYAAQVLAPEELSPGAPGPVVWVDAESGERRALNVDPAARVAYERGLERRLEAWRLSCARHRAVYGCWPSTTPFEDVVTELLS